MLTSCVGAQCCWAEGKADYLIVGQEALQVIHQIGMQLGGYEVAWRLCKQPGGYECPRGQVNSQDVVSG